jgi:hypothetical protein
MTNAEGGKRIERGKTIEGEKNCHGTPLAPV